MGSSCIVQVFMAMTPKCMQMPVSVPVNASPALLQRIVW